MLSGEEMTLRRKLCRVKLERGDESETGTETASFSDPTNNARYDYRHYAHQ